jgi:hypothetical protein
LPVGGGGTSYGAFKEPFLSAVFFFFFFFWLRLHLLSVFFFFGFSVMRKGFAICAKLSDEMIWMDGWLVGWLIHALFGR